MTLMAVTLPDFVRRKDLACGPKAVGGVDPELFVAEGADDGRTTEAKQALAVCWRCPARIECLAYAIDHRERGIWGGTTEKDRRRILSGMSEPRYVVAYCAHTPCRARFARRLDVSQVYCGKNCRAAASYRRRKLAA
jgi:hypothetical protein